MLLSCVCDTAASVQSMRTWTTSSRIDHHHQQPWGWGWGWWWWCELQQWEMWHLWLWLHCSFSYLLGPCHSILAHTAWCVHFIRCSLRLWYSQVRECWWWSQIVVLVTVACWEGSCWSVNCKQLMLIQWFVHKLFLLMSVVRSKWEHSVSVSLSLCLSVYLCLSVCFCSSFLHYLLSRAVTVRQPVWPYKPACDVLSVTR